MIRNGLDIIAAIVTAVHGQAVADSFVGLMREEPRFEQNENALRLAADVCKTLVAGGSDLFAEALTEAATFIDEYENPTAPDRGPAYVFSAGAYFWTENGMLLSVAVPPERSADFVLDIDGDDVVEVVTFESFGERAESVLADVNASLGTEFELDRFAGR